MRQKSSKTQIVPSKNLHEPANKRSNQFERLTLKDQAHIEAENQAGDRPRAAAAPSQLILTSGIPEAVRIMIARKREEAMKKKHEREEGEQVERGTYKHRSNLLEGTEEDRFILEDQAQIEEENQVGDRPRAAAAPSQLILTSGISEEVRIMIARKREEAIKKKQATKTKKDREEGEQVESGTHKKQKSKYSENSKKRNLEALEEEEEEEEEEEKKTSTMKRQN